MTRDINLTGIGLWAVILLCLWALTVEAPTTTLLAGVILVAAYLIGRMSAGGEIGR